MKAFAIATALLALGAASLVAQAPAAARPVAAGRPTFIGAQRSPPFVDLNTPVNGPLAGSVPAQSVLEADGSITRTSGAPVIPFCTNVQLLPPVVLRETNGKPAA